MPGVDRECEGPDATHHAACWCREKYFAKLEGKLTTADGALEDVVNLMSGAPKTAPLTDSAVLRRAQTALAVLRAK